MEKAIDIHNYENDFKTVMVKMHSSDISAKNKNLIEKFGNFCFASSIGKPRVIKYTWTLRKLASWLKKDFDKATKNDIEKVVVTIQKINDYSEWTKRDFSVTLKKFYKWLKGNGEFPSEVKWLSTKVSQSKIKLPGQDGLLTEDDIKKVIEAADHPRNKALISMLYESGCIALCKTRNAVFVINDRKAGELAEQIGVSVVDLETILYSLKDLMDKHQLKQLITDIESKDRVIIVNKNKILK